MIALLAASLTLPAYAQSILPGGAPPISPLPAKMASPPRIARVAPGTVLRNVTILRGKTSVEVHIEASGPVKPAVMLLSQPERIVVDLAGVSCGGGHHLIVNAGDVEGVRVGLHQADPPVTRVVVDLAHRHEYRLLPAGSTVILAIDFSPQPALAAQLAAVNLADVAATSAVPPVSSADTSLTDTQVPAQASEAKLPPPPVAPPEARAPATAEPASSPATQPPEPAVSTTLPQAATLPVPSGQSEPSSSAAGDEETSAHQAAKDSKLGVVRSITVSREKDAIAVHIEASEPLRATASTLSNPERIIIDLADVRLTRPRRIPVNAADVRAISVSLFLVNPLVTRVVVDLARPHAYHLQSSGNSLTVRIETAAVKAAGSQPVR